MTLWSPQLDISSGFGKAHSDPRDLKIKEITLHCRLYLYFTKLYERSLVKLIIHRNVLCVRVVLEKMGFLGDTLDN